MFAHVINARYLDGYRVFLEFNDGASGEVDLHDRLWGPVFEPLRDVDYFRNFTVALDTITWPNGADFAPEFLRKRLDSPEHSPESKV
jgi:hypothetical protein